MIQQHPYPGLVKDHIFPILTPSPKIERGNIFKVCIGRIARSTVLEYEYKTCRKNANHEEQEGGQMQGDAQGGLDQTIAGAGDRHPAQGYRVDHLWVRMKVIQIRIGETNHEENCLGLLDVPGSLVVKTWPHRHR